jgi:hypothetical protein
MNYKNGYKVVYEVAADGKRTFYATKSNAYPAAEDTVLATFEDADFAGKVIYEYKGEFYVSTGKVPAYNEDGTPKDEKITGFEKLFVEENTEVIAPVNTTEEDDNGDDNGDDAGEDDLGDEGDTE